MSGSFARHLRPSSISALSVGLLVFAAEPVLTSSQESFDHGHHSSLATPDHEPPHILPSPDWYLDPGSGGFPQDYANEPRPTDEWVESTDEPSSYERWQR
jgi:hypothetical protein